jgi:hypothetical protein
MRTKTIIEGFKNSQKIRVVINGIIVFTTIRDAAYNLFGHLEQRAATLEAIDEIRRRRSFGANMVGFSGRFRNIDIQVDLI